MPLPDEFPPPVVPTAAERRIARVCGWMDGIVSRLLGGRAWFLTIGLAAVVLSLCVQTPDPPAYTRYAVTDAARALAAQVEHPLTPMNLWKTAPDGRRVLIDDGLHLEKLGFRLTIPVLGKIFRTGKASWLVFTCLSGLIFYPLFAWAVARWMGDRLTAAYLTLAFAASWAGCFFFNDLFFGDTVAWLLLLAAVACSHPGVIFAAVFAAAFTDERALLGSSATLLFWCVRPMPGAAGNGAPQRAAVLAAWAAYLAARMALGEMYDLSTGYTQVGALATFEEHAMTNFPYKALSVFKGLWIWLPLGWLGLAAGRRRWEAAAYACIAGGMFLVVMVVYDFIRTVGYFVVLLPVALRTAGLSPVNSLRLARVSWLVGVVLITPWYTPLRYVFLWFHVPVNQIALP